MMVEILLNRVVEVSDSLIGFLDEYLDVMLIDLPNGLSSKRLVEDRIELMSGAKTPIKVKYRISPKELTKLKIQLGELLDSEKNSIIKSSIWSTCSFLGEDKHRLCVDYQFKTRDSSQVFILVNQLVQLSVQVESVSQHVCLAEASRTL